ncbi:unnamed protein product, partial [Prorocentrum cordatum]
LPWPGLPGQEDLEAPRLQAGKAPPPAPADPTTPRERHERRGAVGEAGQAGGRHHAAAEGDLAEEPPREVGHHQGGAPGPNHQRPAEIGAQDAEPAARRRRGGLPGAGRRWQECLASRAGGRAAGGPRRGARRGRRAVAAGARHGEGGALPGRPRRRGPGQSRADGPGQVAHAERRHRGAGRRPGGHGGQAVPAVWQHAESLGVVRRAQGRQPHCAG